MRPIRFANAVLSLLVLAACSGGGGAPPPPPPQQGQGIQTQQGQTQIQAPPGQVLITVAASSMPPGATVTGGGRMLGRTPFTAQVPIPAPRPGETQTFQFTFQMPGYQPATLSASPINNTITLNTTLAPMTAAVATPTPGTPTPGGPSFTVRGPAGGAIRDFNVTTSAARVDQQCIIDELTVDIDGNHTYFSDLVVSLRGPDGTSYQLQSHASRNPFRNHTVRRAAGHPTGGVWTLSVNDTVRADSGNLRGWSMAVRCR